MINMKSKKKKDLVKCLKIIIIIYLALVILAYIFYKNIEHNSLNDLDSNTVIFLYPAIFCTFIFIIDIIDIYFWKDYANKKAIKNCSRLNMVVPSIERHKEIINNLSKIHLRQFFVEKNSNNLYKFKTQIQHEKNFYLSNEKNELLFIVSTLSLSVTDVDSRYSIIDPYNNVIGEIKIEEPTLSNNQNGQEIWTIILGNRQSFQVTFDLYNLSARKENVIKIINLPLQFNNNFFNEQHLINLDCNLIDISSNELIAEMHDLGVFGNSDISIYNDKYSLEIIVLYMCIVLKRYKDGLYTKVIMLNNSSEKK